MDLLNKNNKCVLFIVSHEDFRDEEYFITREMIENSGINIVTASSDKSPAKGTKGGEIAVDKLFSEISPDDYDGVVVVGGRGIRAYFKNTELQELLKGFFNAGRVIGAICAAPVLLAEAGLLRGKKCTAWHTEEDMEYPNVLIGSGAVFVDTDIVVDGRIVTAKSPEYAKKFGEAVASLIINESRP